MIGLFYCFIEVMLPYLSKFYKSKLVSVLYGILEIQIKFEHTKSEEYMEKQINEKMKEIVYKVNDMIPVEWDDLYINFEVDKTLSGGVIFFFKYKGEYHYYMDIPSLFAIPKTEFRIDYINLFALGEDMKKIFIKQGLAEWSAFTIKVDEQNKTSLDFDYAPWNKSQFGPTDRIEFFEYKYLGKQPANEKELELFKAMEAFQQKYNEN